MVTPLAAPPLLTNRANGQRAAAGASVDDAVDADVHGTLEPPNKEHHNR